MLAILFYNKSIALLTYQNLKALPNVLNTWKFDSIILQYRWIRTSNFIQPNQENTYQKCYPLYCNLFSLNFTFNRGIFLVVLWQKCNNSDLLSLKKQFKGTFSISLDFFLYNSTAFLLIYYRSLMYITSRNTENFHTYMSSRVTEWKIRKNPKFVYLGVEKNNRDIRALL